MHYRSILIDEISRKRSERGYRSRLASAAGCQLSYLLQVVKGKAKLSPDQGLQLCVFWGFDDKETAVFILSILSEKALTDNLKDYYSRISDAIKSGSFD